MDLNCNKRTLHLVLPGSKVILYLSELVQMVSRER